ncbi:hypothetical protein EOD41_11450 [Mucilaginibacter limnophilus]|uniref:Uncharacterized protein n=1 Tax=Mucilaginibacter limnophilus TaxID=1932778 RepID=A0A437MSH9_9SPHI|nr:hypothetical protein [Mucilaginibacter limnophilus]RVU00610.1 hypothetical protein EOD41_11450 [Mucilaginibacter limnophilus]
MKNNNFETISDAYQLVKGAKIKGKTQDEIFELGHYDPDKRGYTVYPYEEGVMFRDFSVLVSEKELKNNYLIEVVKAKAIQAGINEKVNALADINSLKSA